MPKLAIGFEYNGRNFRGSQKQHELRTVQETLESAVSQIADEPVSLVFAGRTDSGVHATNQVASFFTSNERPVNAWIQGTNANLPADIAVHSVCEVPHGFDARRSALRRRYLYVFGLCSVFPAFNVHEVLWVRHSIDVKDLNNLTQLFLGEKDFTSFCAVQDDSTSRCRDIQRIAFKQIGDFVVLDITANAFLLRMVRNIAGCLLAVARGEISASTVESILLARDRSLAPATAAAAGLYLVHVEYENSPRFPLRLPHVLGVRASEMINESEPLQISFKRTTRAL